MTRRAFVLAVLMLSGLSLAATRGGSPTAVTPGITEVEQRSNGASIATMHNGTLATLEDVLRFYDEGRSRNPNVADGGRRRGERRGPTLSNDFRRVDDLSEGEMRDIIAFLHALTDDDSDRAIPERVPSGLPPGGRIR